MSVLVFQLLDLHSRISELISELVSSYSLLSSFTVRCLSPAALFLEFFSKSKFAVGTVSLLGAGIKNGHDLLDMIDSIAT